MIRQIVKERSGRSGGAMRIPTRPNPNCADTSATEATTPHTRHAIAASRRDRAREGSIGLAIVPPLDALPFGPAEHVHRGESGHESGHVRPERDAARYAGVGRERG